MWAIWAIIVVSASLAASDPEMGKNNGVELGSYSKMHFDTEEACKDFLKNPDEMFQRAIKELPIITGVSYKFECRK